MDNAPYMSYNQAETNKTQEVQKWAFNRAFQASQAWLALLFNNIIHA